ncbi:hypothetical protein SKAU_G00266760 [Synaphobranchus kaupii]|uniref:Uncharacterized protein n=1 Tax=Synaphobranchus kaupii TaxID=118154 RepID=A0A9Q1EZH3_SYNKA|nr:hypothetical protein SKAU_G00266760 [Synaphobranchus kaupii]
MRWERSDLTAAQTRDLINWRRFNLRRACDDSICAECRPRPRLTWRHRPVFARMAAFKCQDNRGSASERQHARTEAAASAPQEHQISPDGFRTLFSVAEGAACYETDARGGREIFRSKATLLAPQQMLGFGLARKCADARLKATRGRAPQITHAGIACLFGICRSQGKKI